MFHQIFQYIIIVTCIFEVLSVDPEVEIPQGRLIGSTRTNRDGGTYYSFQRIPYAVPPLGELRFKAPLPAEGWNGTWDATQDLPQCVQLGSDSSNIEGQEDCLYLNIYTSDLPGENVTQKAVMVFLYGGWFTKGSALESHFGGQFLLTKDIVLVVLNYRVGVFGFFSLDDPSLGVTGNAGLKDQVLALQWIKENVEYFGGNPNNVLLFGESAGSMSTHLHMLSPMSAGLFHKAIAQSGVSLTSLGMDTLRNKGEYLGRELGIQTANWNEMLINLQNVSAAELTAAEQRLSFTYEYFSSPIVETPSNEAFIQEYQLDIIRSGNYNQVPFMTGINDAEGLIFESMSLQLTGQSLLISNFSQFIPHDLGIAVESEEEAILSQRIKEFYYGNLEPTRENITGAVNLYTDFAFGFPACRTVIEHLRNALNPIYFYYFTADTRLNQLKQQVESIATYPGAAHADELGYLFQSSLTPAEIEEGSVEDLGIKTMVDLWTNFAIYGNPTPENYNDYIWDPVEENQFYYLHIGTNDTYLDINPIPERIQFWWDVYTEYFADD